MKKRLISLLLAVCMVVGMLPAGALAAGSTSAKLTMVRAANGYDYPDGSEGGNQNASGDGWSYDAGTNTLTLDAPGKTIYLATQDQQDLVIFSDIIVKEGTTFIAYYANLGRHTVNYGEIRYADFYAPGDYTGTEYPLVENHGTITGIEFSYDDRGSLTNYGLISGNNDATYLTDIYNNNFVNKSTGTIRNIWFRRPVRNEGAMEYCTFSFNNYTTMDGTVENNGTISHSTFFGGNSSGYTADDYQYFITGTGTNDYCYFRNYIQSNTNTITNSIIDPGCTIKTTLASSDLHTIRYNDNVSTFNLEMNDCTGSASTWYDKIAAIRFVGSPSITLYRTSKAITSINERDISVGAQIPGVQSIDSIGSHYWDDDYLTFTPDGTRDILLNRPDERVFCDVELDADGVPAAQSGTGWYYGSVEIYGEPETALVVEKGYTLDMTGKTVNVPVYTDGELDGGIYTQSVYFAPNSSANNVMLFASYGYGALNNKLYLTGFSCPKNSIVNGVVCSSGGVALSEGMAVTLTAPEDANFIRWVPMAILKFVDGRGSYERIDTLNGLQDALTERTIHFVSDDTSYLRIALEHEVNKKDNTFATQDASGSAVTHAVQYETVYLSYDLADLPEGKMFKAWKVTAADGSTVELETDTDGKVHFMMPDADVTVELVTSSVQYDPDEDDTKKDDTTKPGTDDSKKDDTTPDIPDVTPMTPVEIASSAAGGVTAGAAIGAAGYLLGTRIYLEAVLPQGSAIPTSRKALAVLLWQTAGKPEPVSTAAFADMTDADPDTLKAARWCTEQGLLSAKDESFHPSRYVTRVQVIRNWNALQKLLKN